MNARRKLVKAALGLTAAAIGLCAQAQAFPDRPITLVVPYAAGGSTDVLARALAEHMGQTLKQPVVVENRPGASGSMGVMRMKQSKPDGYALTIVALGVFRLPYLEKVNYDPVKDLSYVSMLAGYSYAIAVRADSPIQTIDQLIAQSKNGQGLFYGISALYSVNQAIMTELAALTGARLTAVPFKGDSESINALLGGQVQAASVTSTIVPFVKAGKVRVLATAGEKRAKDMPDAPTLLEAGYKMSVLSPLGIAGPAGMPSDVVDKLDAAIHAAVSDPAFQAKADQYGIDLMYRNAADYTAYAKKAALDEKDIVKLMRGGQP